MLLVHLRDSGIRRDAEPHPLHPREGACVVRPGDDEESGVLVSGETRGATWAHAPCSSLPGQMLASKVASSAARFAARQVAAWAAKRMAERTATARTRPPNKARSMGGDTGGGDKGNIPRGSVAAALWCWTTPFGSSLRKASIVFSSFLSMYVLLAYWEKRERGLCVSLSQCMWLLRTFPEEDFFCVLRFTYFYLAYWEKRDRGVVFSRPLRALRAA